MFKFLKRQLQTKTGRLAAILIVGSIANNNLNDPEAAGWIAQAANNILTPEVGVFGALAMFLRDRAAKHDNGEGGYVRR